MRYWRQYVAGLLVAPAIVGGLLVIGWLVRTVL